MCLFRAEHSGPRPEVCSNAGKFVPKTIRSLEHSFPGPFVSLELSFPGPFIPWTIRSRGAMLNYAGNAGNAGDAGDGFMQDAAAWRC